MQGRGGEDMAELITPAASLVCKLMVQGRQSAALLQTHEHAVVRELAAEILRSCDRMLAALHASPGGPKRKPDAHTRPRRRTRASGGKKAPVKIVEKQCTWEDGFTWRKYGQKAIQHSNHPRLYFRCTYRDDSGCPARKQVQQSEEDPSIYIITYFGHHTCSSVAAASEATPPFVFNLGPPAWPSSCSDDPSCFSTNWDCFDYCSELFPLLE